MRRLYSALTLTDLAENLAYLECHGATTAEGLDGHLAALAGPQT